MPVHIFRDAMVLVATSTGTAIAAGVDISGVVASVTLERTYDLHDNTRMGANSRTQLAGIEEWSAELELFNAFSTSQDTTLTRAGGLDALLNDIWDVNSTGLTVGLEIRPINACSSANNPRYFGQVVLESYTPVDGSVGDLLQTTVPFQSGGSLSRASSSA